MVLMAGLEHLESQTNKDFSEKVRKYQTLLLQSSDIQATRLQQLANGETPTLQEAEAVSRLLERNSKGNEWNAVDW